MRRLLFVLMTALVTAALAGCAPRKTCLPEALVLPEVLVPENFGFVDTLQPTFEWTFPATCWPSSYRVEIRESLYRDGLGRDDWPILDGTTTSLPGSATTWTTPLELEPGREYVFSIRPFSGDESGTSVGVWFYTPPVCAADELSVPTPFYPNDRQLMTGSGFRLTWGHEPDCLPQGFRLQIDDDPGFGSPYDTPLIGGPLHWFYFDLPRMPDFEMCTTLHWRVASINGVRGGAISAQSDFSPARSFTLFGPECLDLRLPILEARLIPSTDRDCLVDPDEAAEPVAHVLVGTQLPVDGMDRARAWFHIPLLGRTGCWLPAASGDLQGTVPEDLPVIPVRQTRPPDQGLPGAPVLYLAGTTCTPNVTGWTLSWSSAADTQFYEVYVNGGLAGQTAFTSFQYMLTPPAPGTYSFQVVAYNASGSVWSNSVEGFCP